MSKRRFNVPSVVLLLFAVLGMYGLSSGPVLATAFWLREATGNDHWYLLMWLYFPLVVFGPDSWVAGYIEWWVELFGTVGPG